MDTKRCMMALAIAGACALSSCATPPHKEVLRTDKISPPSARIRR